MQLDCDKQKVIRKHPQQETDRDWVMNDAGRCESDELNQEGLGAEMDTAQNKVQEQGLLVVNKNRNRDLQYRGVLLEALCNYSRVTQS